MTTFKANQVGFVSVSRNPDAIDRLQPSPYLGL